ncbi:hypothetical protein [Pseudomonas sp. UV AK001]|uniref:hypothetical protein n=1 Tax=Pseudomonas sp. UV AK001 TaxID=3384791 RepID=UPI0038D4E6E5
MLYNLEQAAEIAIRAIAEWRMEAKSDAYVVIKAQDMAYEQRGRPQNVLLHSDHGSQNGSRASVK